MHDDDADNVRAVLAGDEGAFSALWEKYQFEAQKWAFLRLGDFCAAEEVAQEAFVEAYKRLESLRQPESFGGWLRQIVNNTAVSWLRQRRRTVPIESVSGMLIDGQWTGQHERYEVPLPDEEIERKAQRERLVAALAALPVRTRRVVELFYFEACAQQAIAEQLGISVAAIKGLLHRARAQLKEEMLKDERGTGRRRLD